MFSYSKSSEFLWLFLVLVLTTLVFFLLNIGAGTELSKEVFGLKLPISMIIFYALNTFVFFGVKEFFRKYTEKLPNIIIVVSGMLVVMSIVFLNLS